MDRFLTAEEEEKLQRLKNQGLFLRHKHLLVVDHGHWMAEVMQLAGPFEWLVESKTFTDYSLTAGESLLLIEVNSLQVIAERVALPPLSPPYCEPE